MDKTFHTGIPVQNGPFYIYGNVIINSDVADPSYFTYTPESNGPDWRKQVYDLDSTSKTLNLVGTPTSNIVDSNGNLTPAYSQYIGTQGWQIGTHPTDIKPLSNKLVSMPQTLNIGAIINQGSIEFSAAMDKEGVFDIKMYDIMGSRIWKYTSSKVEAGIYRIKTPSVLPHLGNGIYLVSLEQGNRKILRKINVMK